MLGTLAAGHMPGLRELNLVLLPAAEARHLSKLAPLTALTALGLGMRGSFADLGGLANLSGLQSLKFSSSMDDNESHHRPVVQSLSPLIALAGLTRLDISRNLGWSVSTIPSDVSVLSSLGALQVLRCGFFVTADVLAGDPLPVQVRFLRTATALEELDLKFWGSFWSMPHASTLAMREAVSALRSLKLVAISNQGDFSQHVVPFYVPLSVFAAASSIGSFKCRNHYFSFGAPRPRGPEAGYSSAQAQVSFAALSKLRKLELAVFWNVLDDVEHAHVPLLADLLAALPSTCLTSLSLSVNVVPLEVMQQIARFPDLQVLQLQSSTILWKSRFLDHLFDFKFLTQLELTVHVDTLPHEGHGDVITIDTEAVQLKNTIVERAGVVGVTAQVELSVRRLGLVSSEQVLNA